MGSDFLADINNNHAQECRMDWGPRFVCGIKTITALGQLLLVTRLELDISTLEIPGSYDSCDRLTTVEEKVNSSSRLHLEAFSKSEQSLSKLSNAGVGASVFSWFELFRRESTAVAFSSFQDEWQRVNRYLANFEQHARATVDCWTCLLTYIQDFEWLITNMIIDHKKWSIDLSKRLEDAKAEVKLRRFEIDPELRDKDDTQGFDFTYAIPLLVVVLFVLLLCGILFRLTIISGMFLFALLILREGIEKSDCWPALDDDNGDVTRDLEIETERLAQKQKRNVVHATIGQTIQEVGISLASAIGGVRETRDSYGTLFERFISLKEGKIDRLQQTMNSISNTIRMDENYHLNSTTDQRQRDSQDVLNTEVT
ncbi:hypothetical protein FGADI_10365 [Fusarium gaditjirri]|uniref:Uncharacterized protein n=1 Tax=Fusarium gaditjirri TaxID=282569 RepID=A0A8H4SXM3_9HYPO|nr:hypothetical protein FGADI_10365 [Fusarium gaditjirri]